MISRRRGRSRYICKYIYIYIYVYIYIYIHMRLMYIYHHIYLLTYIDLFAQFHVWQFTHLVIYYYSVILQCYFYFVVFIDIGRLTTR
jgi:hypothetical protein